MTFWFALGTAAFLYVPFGLFILPLFPSDWKAWTVSFLLLTPAYIAMIWFLYHAPYASRHGYEFFLYGGIALPAVGGNLSRAASLMFESRDWSRRKALIIDFLGFTITVSLFLVIREWSYIPFNSETGIQ